MSGWEDVRPAAVCSAPRFDAVALCVLLEVIGDPTPLIRRGLQMIPSYEWREGAGGMATTFATDLPGHCFHVKPHAWSRYHEPQITAGFAHFLNSGDHRRQLARSIAFVLAAARCAGRAIDVSAVRSAWCMAEENRTDIMVELRGGVRPIGTSIEAKFGHRLTKGQLPKAFRHARDTRDWDVEQSILLVVAPDEADLNTLILRQNRSWRTASWWTLLSHLEQLTDPADDCSDYRRFRRTVWHRAY